jgi:hypothetical protein
MRIVVVLAVLFFRAVVFAETPMGKDRSRDHLSLHRSPSESQSNTIHSSPALGRANVQPQAGQHLHE